MGVAGTGCSDLNCSRVHPYFVARAVENLGERFKELLALVEQLRIQFIEADAKEADPCPPK
jgi:hypothetical protein